MKPVYLKYRELFRQKDYLLSISVAVVLLAASIAINYYAGMYATESASSPVTDIVLNNIPIFDVDGIFFFGPFILWIFVAALCLKRPRQLPFIIKSIALFIIVRSVFVILTHIGPFPGEIPSNPPKTFLDKLMYGGDLFFSGHTGLPFLMALIFQNNKKLFVFFTASAVFFGVVVLMGHFHYSIDVLAAFFITYTIYHIAGWLFKKDKALFESS